MLHFFCAIQTSDGGMEKKRRKWLAVESGGFVVFWFCRSCGVVPSRHIAGSVTFRALRTRLPSLRSVVPSRHRNGTRCALIRESRNGLRPRPDITERAARSSGKAGTGCALSRDGARKSCEDRKSLIYKYICRKMIYFAIKTA